MDRDVVLNKLESLRRCIKRIEDKTPSSPALLEQDYDRQDIIVLNLERAVQVSVDVGLHVIGDLEMPVPETMAQTFASLNLAGLLDDATAQRMIKAVGFRNIAVHAYQEMDWGIVYRVITENLDDFRGFAGQMMAVVAAAKP